MKWSICFEVFKQSILSCSSDCQALGNVMHKQLMAAFRKQTGSGRAVTKTASGPITVCVWYCSKVLNVIIYELHSVCRKRCMFWWWLTLMPQAASNQYQLTGGTGWSWTYRYSKSVNNQLCSRLKTVCFGDGDTDSICYWIRNSWYKFMKWWNFFSLKFCIFIISGLTWHDLCLHLHWGRSRGWKIMNGF